VLWIDDYHAVANTAEGAQMRDDSQNDGGPAFHEVPADCNGYEGRPGMTLRDYFAAKAMEAFAAGAQNMGDMDRAEVRRQFDLVGDFAYLMADSMLKARSA
jgi:hypothetical protein